MLSTINRSPTSKHVILFSHFQNAPRSLIGPVYVCVCVWGYKLPDIQTCNICNILRKYWAMLFILEGFFSFFLSLWDCWCMLFWQPHAPFSHLPSVQLAWVLSVTNEVMAYAYIEHTNTNHFDVSCLIHHLPSNFFSSRWNSEGLGDGGFSALLPPKSTNPIHAAHFIAEQKRTPGMSQKHTDHPLLSKIKPHLACLHMLT